MLSPPPVRSSGFDGKGVEYFESASHQVRGKTIRSLYAMAAVNYARTKKESYIPRFADVKTAFLTRKRRATDPELYSLGTITEGLTGGPIESRGPNGRRTEQQIGS